MAKKKSKITTLVVNSKNIPEYAATCFRADMKPTTVGNEQIELMPVVKSISFARHAYGQGAVVDEPCYFVSFEDSDEVLIVPASERVQVIVSTDSDDDAHTPALPE